MRAQRLLVLLEARFVRLLLLQVLTELALGQVALQRRQLLLEGFA